MFFPVLSNPPPPYCDRLNPESEASPRRVLPSSLITPPASKANQHLKNHPSHSQDAKITKEEDSTRKDQGAYSKKTRSGIV